MTIVIQDVSGEYLCDFAAELSPFETAWLMNRLQVMLAQLQLLHQLNRGVRAVVLPDSLR